MVEKASEVMGQRGLASRPANSRKLLSQKARERVPTTSGPSLEDSFPTTSPMIVPAIATEPPGGVVESSAPAAAPVVKSPTSPNRKPRLRPGDIAPNAGTIVAAIVRLVVERGEISRQELIALMSDATLAHPKARPAEKGWSQGYVAGAIRGGFLAVASEPSIADAGQAPYQEARP